MERSIIENYVPSLREQAKNDKSKVKPERVCKFSCVVYVGNHSYELMATTKERLINQQKIHAASYPKDKVSFSKIKEL